MGYKTKVPLLRACLVAVWLVFGLSLTCWWIIFGLRQVDQLHSLLPAQDDQFVRHHRMLVMEGASLFIWLLCGGIALAYFMYREFRERRAVDSFLAVFSHELKTPMASLRLQAETLQEEISGDKGGALIDRLVADTARLALQLENCLYLARQDELKLFMQRLPLREIVSSMKSNWPGLKITYTGDCSVMADQRALASIFQNLIQNSVSHGKATVVEIRAQAAARGCVVISVRDNGGGFAGNLKLLGRPFERFYEGSGSGIGLYLAGRLAKQMSGELRIAGGETGFEAVLHLKGGMEK